MSPVKLKRKKSITTMNPRAGISILVCSIGILSAQAQSEKKDSLLSKKEEEIYINPEAVKSIEFNFMAQPEAFKPKPKMDESKPWMEFRKDLPMSLTDTTTLKKKKYIRMLPYSIWGYDDSAERYMQEDTLTIKLDLEYLKKKYAPGHKPLVTFDMEKLLYENFTKRGRAIRRNKKKAKAWKIYKDYVPTKEDSLKWYGNKKRIPKDTLNINKDSVDHFMNTK